MIFRNIILSLIVLGTAVGGSFVVISRKPKATMKPKVNSGVLVEAKTFDRASQDAIVVGQGIVTPAEQVNIIAQVSGLVARVHTELSPGGRVKQGDQLLQIDQTDYSLMVNEARARVKIAEQEVSLEAGRHIAAENDWKMMQRRSKTATQVSEDAKSRALREPQRAIAENNLAIAKNALKRAQVNYNRTSLKAPFNGVILSESVDQGQLIGPGAPVATLAGTDVFWVTASIPTSELGWIELPKTHAKTKRKKRTKTTSHLGSKALIRYDVGAQVIEREGYVIRQLTQVETTGRMARVVIEVKDPLGIENELPPLLLGAQVEVKIIGKPLSDVIEVPRSAIHEDQLWVFKPEMSPTSGELSAPKSQLIDQSNHQSLLLGKLEVRPIKVLRRREQSVLIRTGLTEDELVITSRLPTPVPGMRLRLAP